MDADSIDTTDPSREPWPPLDSLEEHELPTFPTDALPVELRDFVESESEATQTPPDISAMLCLAAVSATVARRVVVAPRAGWVEPVNLFVAAVLEPGNRKSAAFSDAIRPLSDYEKELIERERPRIAREQSERRQLEQRLKEAERKAATKGDVETRQAALTLAEELERYAVPVAPRLLVSDATAEKLGMLLEEQGGRIASMNPEGGVFDLMAGLYSKGGGPQFEVYLKGHAGEDLTTDRITRATVHVKRAALTCGYAIQPEVIRALAKNPAFRGRGLLARFLYAVPRSLIGSRRIGAPPVPQSIRDAYDTRIRSLLGDDREIRLRLSRDACESFEAWEREIEEELADGGLLEQMRDWGGKLAGATARIAAVLHCFEYGAEGTIETPTIEAGVRIARYLIPHAETALRLMTAKESRADDDARYVLRWIRERGLREFSKRDAHQHGRRRFKSVNDIDAPFQLLCDRGYLRKLPNDSAGPGRSPSPRYAVNPAVFENRSPESRTHNTQNDDRPGENGNCEYFEDSF